MFGRGIIMGQTPAPISFVTSQSLVNSPSIIASNITGAAAGDLCLMVINSGQKMTVGAGGPEWPGASAVGGGRLYARILTSGDLSAIWYFEDAGGAGATTTYGYIWVWRGTGAAIASGTPKSNVLTAAASITIPGYAPSASGKPRAVVSVIMSTGAGAGTPTPPSGHTLRAGTDASYQRYASDKLVGADQSAATWSGLSGASNNAGWLVEVL